MSTETVVQQNTRLQFCSTVQGGQIWRNNSGAMKLFDEHGNERMVRFGLGNDSEKVNREIKSSDLIGITPVLIEPHMIGYHLGVFTAFECKPTGWTMRPSDDRAIAQARYHDLVRQACGFAGFVTNPADMYRIIGRAR